MKKIIIPLLCQALALGACAQNALPDPDIPAAAPAAPANVSAANATPAGPLPSLPSVAGEQGKTGDPASAQPAMVPAPSKKEVSVDGGTTEPGWSVPAAAQDAFGFPAAGSFDEVKEEGAPGIIPSGPPAREIDAFQEVARRIPVYGYQVGQSVIVGRYLLAAGDDLRVRVGDTSYNFKIKTIEESALVIVHESGEEVRLPYPRHGNFAAAAEEEGTPQIDLEAPELSGPDGKVMGPHKGTAGSSSPSIKSLKGKP